MHFGVGVAVATRAIPPLAVILATRHPTTLAPRDIAARVIAGRLACDLVRSDTGAIVMAIDRIAIVPSAIVSQVIDVATVATRVPLRRVILARPHVTLAAARAIRAAPRHAVRVVLRRAIRVVPRRAILAVTRRPAIAPAASQRTTARRRIASRPRPLPARATCRTTIT